MQKYLRLCGKTVAESIYNKIKQDVTKLKDNGLVPGLAVIQVGDNKDSTTYVNMKAKMCEKYNIFSRVINLPTDIEEQDIINVISDLNKNQAFHGILIQLPLPKHICEDTVLNTVSIKKDVDGFNIHNVGQLSINGKPSYVPCTPDGCIQILKHYNYNVIGKHAVIIGRSRIVGMPLANLLLKENATVTVCHSKTENLDNITKTADFLFAACGRAEMIKKSMVKEDCVIIDIGINPIDDNTKKSGYRLVGDVDYNDVKDKCNAITPVPGGVGPMTIAMLLRHTVDAAMEECCLTAQA